MDLTKIYGIAIDESLQGGGEQRIMDAAGLKNDYVVDGNFQNDGTNDFDNAYPFGAMRLCNVRIENGCKQVIYEGEPGFSRTGSGGNVMVEIPKFYSRREKQGSVEKWLISGACHEGFSIEPCFCRGGKELDFVYVGVYNSTNCGDGVFSCTYEFPDIDRTMDDFRKNYAQYGFDGYDFAIHLALQKLLVIEFGRRDVRQVLGGIGRMKYFATILPHNTIEATAPNCVSILKDAHRNLNFAPGHEIGFGHITKDLTYHRKVTDVKENPHNDLWVDVYYDGEDMSGIVAPKKDAIYGIPQRNGLTDKLNYHTGRVNFCPPLAMEQTPFVSPFRYRNIENVWGNVWEMTAGLKMHKLNYYYTFEPELYDASINQWNKFPYPATEMNELPDLLPDRPHWVAGMGYDENAPQVLLPIEFASGKMGDHYDGLIYSYYDKDFCGDPMDVETVYTTVTGGGWDHMYMSLFAYRCFLLETDTHWLYSNRVCLR